MTDLHDTAAHIAAGAFGAHAPGCAKCERLAAQETGRQLASEREDLIAAGADPAELLIPLHPDDPEDS